ncbi:MAG: GNAT family N-acetyltransferase [Muribaculaceae bacterium]|nr:GNAT family N-acetyltransferase [Muribaculaceae bacterium]
MSLVTLKSDILTLRAPEEADVDRLFLWENDRDLMESVANAAPVSRFQMWEYIRNYAADPFSSSELRLVVSLPDGTAAGHIDLYDFDKVNRRAGIGIYIDEDFRRQGFGAEAIRLLCQYVEVTLGIHQLWATVAVDNKASLALFEGAGFKPAGKLRSWIRRGGSYADALIMQRLFA